MARKRKLSSTSIGDMGSLHGNSFDADAARAESKITSTIKGFFESITGSAPDPTNTVINGATIQSKPFLARVLADIASQGSRIGDNIGLIHSLVDTTLFDGGLVDDRQYQVGILQGVP